MRCLSYTAHFWSINNYSVHVFCLLAYERTGLNPTGISGATPSVPGSLPGTNEAFVLIDGPSFLSIFPLYPPRALRA